MGWIDWTAVLSSALAGLLYLNTLKGNFVYDDSRAILSNSDILPSTPWTDIWSHDFWGTPLSHSGSHKSFRPLTTLSLRWNYAYSPDPSIFHLTNVLLHVVTTWLFTRVARVTLSSILYSPVLTPARLANRTPTGRRLAILVSSLVFAAHPLHTEAVAGIVGRADVGTTAFALSTFLAYVNHVKFRDKVRALSGTKMEESHSLLCSRGKHRVGARKLVEFDSHGTSAQNRMLTFRVKSYGWLAISVLLAGAAMLSKEQGISVLLICASFDVSRSLIKSRQKRASPVLVVLWNLDCFWSLLIVGGSFVTLLSVRLSAMGGLAETPTFSKADNPTAHQPHMTSRLLTFLYLPLFNFYLLLFPRQLSYDWSMDAIRPITSFCDIRNVLSFLFYFVLVRRILQSFHILSVPSPDQGLSKGLCALCWINPMHRTNNNSLLVRPNHDSLLPYSPQVTLRSTGINRTSRTRLATKVSPVPSPPSSPVVHAALLLQLAFLILPFLPATNLFFYVGFVVAERVTYMPSVGFCLLLGHGTLHLWQRFGHKCKIVLSFSATLCVLLFCFQTVLRNEDWITEERLYRAGIPINPPKSWGNLGHVLSRAGRKAEAEVAFRQALTFRSNMADVHFNLGLLLESDGRVEEALGSYRSAIHFRPLLAPAYVSLGQALLGMGRRTEAMSVFERCFHLDDDGVKDLQTHSEAKVKALLSFGRLLLEGEDAPRAIHVYRQALDVMPPNYAEVQTLYNALGEALFRNGATSEGERWVKKALRQKPDHIPAYLTYGKMLARNKTRLLEAESWFRRAKKLAPGDSSVYHHYGQFLSMQGRHREASEALVAAATFAPTEYDIVVSAANALRQIGDNKKAEGFYEKAVTLRPQESRAHMNLGAILHINGKYREAEGSYLTALKLQPADDVTLLNLQKLRQLQSRVNQSSSARCHGGGGDDRREGMKN